MNKKQLAIMWLGIVVIVALCLFPPYARIRPSSLYIYQGHYFVFSTGVHGRIDYYRLGLEIVPTVLLFVGLFFTLPKVSILNVLRRRWKRILVSMLVVLGISLVLTEWHLQKILKEEIRVELVQEESKAVIIARKASIRLMIAKMSQAMKDSGIERRHNQAEIDAELQKFMEENEEGRLRQVELMKLLGIEGATEIAVIDVNSEQVANKINGLVEMRFKEKYGGYGFLPGIRESCKRWRNP